MSTLVPLKAVPVIDFTGKVLISGTEEWSWMAKRVCDALSEPGCFIVTFDRDLPRLHDAMIEASSDLSQARNVGEKYYHGYVGHMTELAHNEGLGIDDATDMEAVREFTRLMWRHGNDAFRYTPPCDEISNISRECEVVHSYSKRVAELDGMLIRMIFHNYGVGKYYENHAASKTCLLRLLKYGSTNATNDGDRDIALPWHTDKDFLSILHQNQVNGLEIRTRNGEWIGVDLTPSSAIVIAGEALMAWSNDRIYPCEHRVTMKKEATRCTLGLFTFIDGMVRVPEELVNDEHPLAYKPFNIDALVEFFAKDERRFDHEFTVKVYCGI